MVVLRAHHCLRRPSGGPAGGYCRSSADPVACGAPRASAEQDRCTFLACGAQRLLAAAFNIVKAYLVDTEHELLFREEAQEGKAELGPWKEKKLQDWFYRQLLSHPKLNGAGNQGALDTTGAKWMTAKGLFAT